jgi:hypothetical protein
MYMVLSLTEWRQVKIEGEEIEPSTEGSVGFLEVFETEEAARAAYPEADVQQIGIHDEEEWH